MYKEVVRALETGILPQIGLIAFVVAFACVVVYAFTLSAARRRAFAALPFDDGVPVAPGASNGHAENGHAAASADPAADGRPTA